MKNIDQETYFKAFESTTQEKRDLLESTKIYDSAETLIKSLNLNVNPRKLIIPIGNWVLGLCQIEELLEELTSLGVIDSYGFFKKLNELISTSVQTPPTPPPAASLAEEIKQTEQSFANTGVRTMAGDMRAAGHAVEVPVHQSSQADILSRAAPPPPPPVQESPRWESD